MDFKGDISNLPVADVSLRYGITEEDAEIAIALAKNLKSQRWRLDHLYKIVAAVPVERDPTLPARRPDSDEDAPVDTADTVIPFRMNYAQKLLYLGFWYCNLILKSRQHGITTFICLLYLDICLFNSNTHACIIAHNREDAEDFFEKKILFAYENLPEDIKAAIPANRSSSKKLVFANGSSIRVTTSGRSGTYHLVHVSEFGKMCAKFPLKAREVVSGTLNAIHAGMLVSIESTAEGREGRFYDMTVDAMKIAEKVAAGTATLNKMDYKFFFFGWMHNELNQADPKGVVFYDRHNQYFEEIEQKLRIVLSDRQKAWYVKKEAVQGDLMLQEHPSTPEEAFHESVEGAYYRKEMSAARKDGRIGDHPPVKHIPVDTWWDLGYDDTNSIWFTQTIGSEIRVIHYYENCHESMIHYAKYCEDYFKENKLLTGHWWAPWDIIQHEYTSGKTRLETAREAGIIFQTGSRTSIPTQIQLVRNILPVCRFNEPSCEDGIAGLDSYRKEWDEKVGKWKDRPLHDWASHPASAFATMAVNHPLMTLNRRGVAPTTDEIRERLAGKKNPKAWT